MFAGDTFGNTQLICFPFDSTGLKYQHWGKVLNAVRDLKLSVLSSALPDRGVLLGGSLTLHGKAVSLACFHGVNFRSQSWVLFTLQRPYMTFASKVCTVEKSCQVRRVKAVQDLALRLGHGADDTLSGKLSPSSGEEIARGDNHTRAFVRVRPCACSVLLSLFYIFFSLSFLP